MEKFPLKEMDNNIINSGLSFVPVGDDKMDFYQKFSSMGLKYIYLRNNLYVYKKFEEKEHFTLFCSDDKYYSYNYIKKCFIDVDAYMLNDNINKNKIGIYDDEKFKMMEERIVL